MAVMHTMHVHTDAISTKLSSFPFFFHLQEEMTSRGVRIRSADFDICNFPVAVIGHSNSYRLPETARLKAAWDIF